MVIKEKKTKLLTLFGIDLFKLKQVLLQSNNCRFRKTFILTQMQNIKK